MNSGLKAKPLRTLDLFCGAGGSSWGAQSAGAHIVAAADLWSLARDTYLDNFDDVRIYKRRIENLSLNKLRREVGKIDLLIGSPECTSHTCAKGNGEKSEKSSMTAFQMNRFAKVLKPRWLVIENVIHIRSWERYQDWIDGLEKIGYKLRIQVLNAADFGVPQSRKRLFIIGGLEMMPPKIQVPKGTEYKSADDIINPNGDYQFSNLRSAKRATATLARAKRAFSELGKRKSFLLVYYGTDGAGGWQRLDAPLRTITTVDRFAYVRPGKVGHQMRMLQVPELRKAMGFPSYFKLDNGTRRDKIKLLGNAVCPPVMKAIVKAIIQATNLSGDKDKSQSKRINRKCLI